MQHQRPERVGGDVHVEVTASPAEAAQAALEHVVRPIPLKHDLARLGVVL